METRRSHPHRTGRLLLAAVATLGLVAGACSKKDSGSSGGATTTAASSVTTAGGGDTTVPATEAPTTTAAKKKPVMGGTLKVSGEAEVANAWTPGKIQCDQYCYVRASTFFDTLLVRNSKGEFVGSLVDKFEHNADYTVWTFHMREGIKFTDGTPVDAEAAVFNLKEQGASLLTAAAISDMGRLPDGTLAAEVVDPMTFTIKTGKGGDLTKPVPWPVMPTYLTGQLGYIASPTWLKAAKADPTLEGKPVGSGPFIVESYAPQEKLVVKRNPNYWMKDADGNQLPYLDGIEFRVIQDSETAAEALKNGDIDVFGTSSSAVIADFRKVSDTFPMTEQDQFVETNYSMIDLAKPGPLQDQRVRCALRKATNNQELIDLTGGGILKVANGLRSPGQEGYLADNGNDGKQDIEGAKALIADYLKEHPGPITVKYGTTVSNLNAQTAELLKGYWKEIGVDTTIVQVPQDQYITKALFGDPDYEIFGWRQHSGQLIDAQYLWWHSSNAKDDGQLSLNFARLKDPIIDENLDKARSEADPAKRQTYAEAINKEMVDKCWNLPSSWTLWGVPHKPAVQGLGELVLPDGSAENDNGGFFGLTGAWLDKAA